MWGETVAAAVMRAVLLDRACATQPQAMAAGGPARWSDDDEVLAKRNTYRTPHSYQSGYDYLLRKATAGSFPAPVADPVER
jgi:ribulose-5-phosphate 4-epimerase/fuculose-1-phosphate aldolase